MKTTKMLVQRYLLSSAHPEQQRVLSMLLKKSAPVSYMRTAGMFTMNNQINNNKMMTHYNMRSFSLPAHQKLEMPNLSPTMEKVSIYFIYL